MNITSRVRAPRRYLLRERPDRSHPRVEIPEQLVATGVLERLPRQLPGLLVGLLLEPAPAARHVRSA